MIYIDVDIGEEPARPIREHGENIALQRHAVKVHFLAHENYFRHFRIIMAGLDPAISVDWREITGLILGSSPRMAGFVCLFVTPMKVGVQLLGVRSWIPASAGMTMWGYRGDNVACDGMTKKE